MKAQIITRPASRVSLLEIRSQHPLLNHSGLPGCWLQRCSASLCWVVGMVPNSTQSTVSVLAMRARTALQLRAAHQVPICGAMPRIIFVFGMDTTEVLWQSPFNQKGLKAISLVQPLTARDRENTTKRYIYFTLK